MNFLRSSTPFEVKDIGMKATQLQKWILKLNSILRQTLNIIKYRMEIEELHKNRKLLCVVNGDAREKFMIVFV
jgi:hypothetical protein